MLTIKANLKGGPFETTLFQYLGKEDTPDEVRALANDIWDSMKKNPDVKQLRGYLPDGTVMMPPEEKEMTYGVWAYFSTTKDGKHGKLYPFECDSQLHENDEFIAMPNGVPAIATVFACRWTERSKVVAACNGRKLFKIKQAIRAV